MYNAANKVVSICRRYLTETVGKMYNVTFELKYMNFDQTYEFVESKEIDLVYTTPTAYTCLEREYGAAPWGPLSPAAVAAAQ